MLLIFLHQKEVSDLSQRLASMEADHKTALADQEKERMKLEEQCKKLSLETSRLQDEAYTSEQDLVTHKTLLAELRHEKASLLSECESLRHRAVQWEEEEKARTAGSEANEKMAAARMEMLVKEKQELAGEVERLHSELKKQEQTAQAECGVLQERVSQLEIMMGNKNRELERVSSELQSKLQDAVETMTHELETSKEKRKTAEQQLMAAQAAMKTTEQKTVHLVEENKTLQVKVTESEEGVCAIKQELAEFQCKLQESDTRAEEERRARETALEESACEIKQLSEQLIKEERKNTDLMQKLTELSGDREQLDETIKNNLEKTTEKLEDMIKENSTLKATIGNNNLFIFLISSFPQLSSHSDTKRRLRNSKLLLLN